MTDLAERRKTARRNPRRSTWVNDRRSCAQCGEDFSPKSWQTFLDWGTTRFCSRACVHDNLRQTVIERFNKYGFRNYQTGCLEWTGTLDEYGYGYLTVRKERGNPRRSLVHRESWEIDNGPIPNGMWVLHKCDNRACFEISHLFFGTVIENVADMISKGRQSRGEKFSKIKGERLSKLTEDQVRSIKTDKRPRKVVAAEYGICKAHISNIRSGKVWKHLNV